MSNFDDRKKGFEAKYQHDQELRFRIQNRRNKLLGLWAAGLLGRSGAEAEAYARSVVAADFEKPGDDDVHDKVHADLTAAGIDAANQLVRRRMTELLEDAAAQVQSEQAG